MAAEIIAHYKVGESVYCDISLTANSLFLTGFGFVFRGTGDMFSSADDFIKIDGDSRWASYNWYDYVSYLAQNELNIPDGITSIADKCFYHCDFWFPLWNLYSPGSYDGVNITLGNSLISIGSRAFEQNYVQKNETIIKSITGGNNVETLKDNCFYGCARVTELLLTKAKYIYNGVFCNCGDLINLKIDDDWEFVQGDNSSTCNTFKNCFSLKSINSINRIVNLKDEMYYQCRSLTSVSIDNNETIDSINALFVDKNSGIELDDNGNLITTVYTNNEDIINYDWTQFNRHFILGSRESIKVKLNNDIINLNLYNSGDIGIKINNNMKYLKIKNELRNEFNPPVYIKINEEYWQVQNY